MKRKDSFKYSPHPIFHKLRLLLSRVAVQYAAEVKSWTLGANELSNESKPDSITSFLCVLQKLLGLSKPEFPHQDRKVVMKNK